MSLNGIRNLVPRSVLNDDALQPLLRKYDEHRKCTQNFLDYFNAIYRNFEQYRTQLTLNSQEISINLKNQNHLTPIYYKIILQLFGILENELDDFIENNKRSINDLIKFSKLMFNEFNNYIVQFQQILQNYHNNQNQLIKLTKKYNKSVKNLQTNIESYKISFSDARLIYNSEQKHKRYQICQNNYHDLKQQIEIIKQLLITINEQKQEIIKSYCIVKNQFNKNIQAIGIKIISETKNMIKYFRQYHKIIITGLANKKYILQKMQLSTIIEIIIHSQQIEIFECDLSTKQYDYIANILKYHEYIKKQYLSIYYRKLSQYLKKIYHNIQIRKIINKKIIQYIYDFLKLFQKTYLYNLKQIILLFDKIKKQTSQIFSNRFISFQKCIIAIFQLSIGLTQKMLKNIYIKIKNIQYILNQENNLLNLFEKELKNNMQKIFGKKQNKKIINNQNQLIQQQNNIINYDKYKKDIHQKVQFLIHLITGFNQKMNKNYTIFKNHFNQIINDIFQSLNQLYQLCCQHQVSYFGQQQFKIHFQKYETQFIKFISNQQKYFDELNFQQLIKDKSIITFDYENNKVDQFIKLKKPINKSKQNKQKLQESNKITNQNLQIKISQQYQKNQLEDSSNLSNSKIQQINNNNNIQGDKNYDYLKKKIHFLNGQKFIKSFNCGLADIIILTGRIYITTQRLCFSSFFNPKNVFFGSTFIDIPKNDIKKIEKRYNAIFFNNTISITTINGQVIFTSFFSRNQAYELICQTFDININDIIFQDNDVKLDETILTSNIQQDDIKQEDLQHRFTLIEKHLKNSIQYDKCIYQNKIQFNKLNALKLFKICDNKQQFNFQNKIFPSFFHYYLQQSGCKDIQQEIWNPSIIDYLNPCNIKNNTPEIFTRKLYSLVPVSNSGMPFLPKFVKSEQKQQLYLFSQNKYIVDSIIKNQGAPYVDCFEVHIRRVIETVSEDTCQMTVYLKVLFVKNILLRNTIESRTEQTTLLNFQIFHRQISKYFKYLSKLQRKQNILNNENNENSNQLNNIENLEKQIQNLQQKNNNLKKKNTQSQIMFNQMRIVIIVSIVLNLFLFMIIIN